MPAPAHQQGPVFAGPPPSVLVVEDEALIAMMLEDTLVEAGCAVTVCHDAAAALSAWATKGGGFDALVVNLGLPDLRGWELARRLRSQRDGLPVVVVSGYSVSAGDLAAELEACTPGTAAFLLKPFSPSDLVTALERVTTAAAPPGSRVSASGR